MARKLDLLRDSIGKLYARYLATCFGGALILCVYSLVDMIAVGQYEGPDGTAALTTVLPIWTTIFSLGLLFGIGGSVLMSTARGAGDKERGDQIFTVSSICIGVLSLVAWILVLFFDRPLLMLFGARGNFLELGLDYIFWIKLVLPLFILAQFLAAFIRNDHAPGLATAAVIAGGAFNIFGDIFFVFVCDMGVSGAGLATALGEVITAGILFTHFLTKKCALRFVKPTHFFSKTRSIIASGIPTFLVDFASGVLITLFNNQIMLYAGADALAVFGVASNVAALVQACGSGVGQAAQPLLSINYGAKAGKRVTQTLVLGIATVAALGILLTTLTLLFPTPLVLLFMDATPAVLEIAPHILRIYFLSFLLLTFNVFSAYYFQAITKTGCSLTISIVRGIALSGVLIYLLPLLFGAEMLWWIMPITEVVTAALVIVFLFFGKRRSPQCGQTS